LAKIDQNPIIEWLVVIFLVLAGGWSRFVNFPNTLIWTNDSARDITVGYLIAEQNLY
jgi:hypothetical protein